MWTDLKFHVVAILQARGALTLSYSDPTCALIKITPGFKLSKLKHRAIVGQTFGLKTLSFYKKSLKSFWISGGNMLFFLNCGYFTWLLQKCKFLSDTNQAHSKSECFFLYHQGFQYNLSLLLATWIISKQKQNNN